VSEKSHSKTKIIKSSTML